MDNNSITVEILINRVLLKPALINTSYKYNSIVNKDLITELWLPRMKMPLKPVTGFVKENTKKPGVKITKIAKLSINIERYKRNIFAYIVPVLLNPVIIRLLWIKEDNTIMKPVTNILNINSYGLKILTKKIPVSLKIRELITTPFATLIKGARKRQKPLIIFKVSFKNITKALHPKIIKTPAEIKKLLPAQYYNYLPFFEGDMAAELPPHHLSINHIFTLEKGENGQERNPPWSLLYGITRNKLLVLRKTLNELLDKEFIYANYSPIGVLVLFVKKKGGLRFYMDYRSLNNITMKNRYPLPIIKETLSSISKAKYFTKLNITAAFHKIRITKA